jgi:hypothetical protein
VDGQFTFNSIDKRFRQILLDAGYKLQQHEEILINQALLLVANLCIKPRDVVRWSNRLAWNFDALKNSVNVADLCVVEMLYLCLDKAEWSALLKHQSQQEKIKHAGGSSNIGVSSIEIEEGKIDKQFDSPQKVEAVKFIFFHPDFDTTNIRRNRRLTDKTIWTHYQKNNTGELKITGAEADKIIQNAESLENLKQNLKNPEKQRSALLEILEITQYIQPNSIPDNSDVIKILCDIINITYGIYNSNDVNLKILDPFDIALNLFISLKEDKIDEAFGNLDIYAAAETGLRFTEFINKSSDERAQDSYKLGDCLSGKAIARMESQFQTIDDTINYSCLIDIYCQMRGSIDAKNKLNSIIETPNGLQKIGAELSIENANSYAILKLIENKDDFLKQLEQLGGEKILKFIEHYRNLPNQDNN